MCVCACHTDRGINVSFFTACLTQLIIQNYVKLNLHNRQLFPLVHVFLIAEEGRGRKHCFVFKKKKNKHSSVIIVKKKKNEENPFTSG